MTRAYQKGLTVLGGEDMAGDWYSSNPNAPPPVPVTTRMPTWQAVAILVGALASCATLWMAFQTTKNRRLA